MPSQGLLTVSGTDPDTHAPEMYRSRALRYLAETDVAEGVVAFALDVMGQPCVRWCEAESSSAAIQGWAQAVAENRHAAVTAELARAQSCAPRQQRNRFRRRSEVLSDRAFFATHNHRLLWGPLGITDAARAVLVQHDRLIASVAFANTTGPVDRSLHRIVADRTERVVALFGLADRLDRAQDPSGPGTVVLDASGQVVFTCSRGRLWIDHDRIEALALQVRRAERGANIDGMIRLDGQRVLYLVHLDPPTPLKLCALASLTARQQEVFRLLLQGQTRNEIGDSLSIGAETVKSHIRAIHVAFQTRSRAELFATVARDHRLRDQVFS